MMFWTPFDLRKVATFLLIQRPGPLSETIFAGAGIVIKVALRHLIVVSADWSGVRWEMRRFEYRSTMLRAAASFRPLCVVSCFQTT